MRAFFLHLPLIALLLILGFFTLVDAGWLSSLRTESTFGWMVLVWYPLCAVLAVAQVIIWIRWIVRRWMPVWTESGRMRAIVTLVLLALVATLLVLGALRLSQRWGAGM